MAQWIYTDGPNGISEPYINSLLVSGEMVYAGTLEGIFLLENNKLGWSSINNGVTNNPQTQSKSVSSLTSNSNYIFSGFQYDGVYRRHIGDNEIFWEEVNNDIPYFPMAISSKNDTIFVGTLENGMYRSTDNGLSWFSINSGLKHTGYHSLLVTDSIIFAGTSGTIYRSLNNGSEWTKSDLGSSAKNYMVEALAISGNNIIAGASNTGSNIDSSLYLSTDNGLNWNSVSCSFEKSNITSLASYQNIVFAGTEIGVFISTDNGLNWKSVNEGLSDLYINSITCSNNFAYVATRGKVWYRPIEELIVSVNESLPTHYSLSQNYPNPFNPDTKIVFSIPKSDMVEIKVYDILGRELKTLFSEYKQAGKYKITFIANNLPSGVYIYKMNTNHYSEIKKMILLR